MRPASVRGLSFEPLRSAGVDDFHALCVNEHVRAYLLDGLVLPRGWAEEEVTRSEQLFAEQQVGIWLLRDGLEAIGFAGFRVFETMSLAPQLLYAIHPHHAGRGLATAVAKALVAHVRALGWTRIEAAVDAPNRASINVLKKTGLWHCGTVPGAFGDTLLFEWHAAPPTRLIRTRESFSVEVGSTWDGHALDAPFATVEVAVADTELRVSVDAAFVGDPPPPGPVGSTDALWDHEVVELMLLGADDRYLEIELSPHGHYLVLHLHGYRQVVHQGVEMHYEVRREGNRWHGRARVPKCWLPYECARLNAFAAHREGNDRRYLAWQPRREVACRSLDNARPDFHHLAAFGTIADL